MAILIVESLPGLCGIAWFNVIDYGMTMGVVRRSCLTSTSATYTLGHELAHNYGASHDPANAGNPATPYAYGYLVDNASGQPTGLRTIMS